MNINIIQHNGVFVAGYSANTRKVYYTKRPDNAKRFLDSEIEPFISLHDDCGHCFRRCNVMVQTINKQGGSNGTSNP